MGALFFLLAVIGLVTALWWHYRSSRENAADAGVRLGPEAKPVDDEQPPA